MVTLNTLQEATRLLQKAMDEKTAVTHEEALLQFVGVVTAKCMNIDRAELNPKGAGFIKIITQDDFDEWKGLHVSLKSLGHGKVAIILTMEEK